MAGNLLFTKEERTEVIGILRILRHAGGLAISREEEKKIYHNLKAAADCNDIRRDVFGMNPILLSFQTALIAYKEIGLKRDGIIAILLYTGVRDNGSAIEKIRCEFGENVSRIIKGLVKIQELYKKNPVIESENFRNLLLSFAEDMRVILIMIADRVNLMRQIRDTGNMDAKYRVSEEASYLYAPLAHKLGLYKLKSELEDLSLKYLEHDAYYMIKNKLNETKKSRDMYIEKFIAPIEDKLRKAGLKFHMKGRTKSIHSIWQKMKKQKCDFEGIFDLFAIRIILDSPLDMEKVQCWQVFAIITNMYVPNPKRMRDWLSVPKSNGYESLHITVNGPEGKWVEVQIRTERMDDVAERGLAAHWRYKGIKGESGQDDWLNSIRRALESKDDMQVMDQFKMDLYEDEIFVFTPKGDLMRFPKGATILDFAYHIHSNVGNSCVGARINDRIVTLRYVLRSGDQIDVITSNNQHPKQDWFNIVKTSRAKSKIRQALKETQVKDGLYAKEMLERRMKNRKIELSEATMSHLIKKLGFKETKDFYKKIADETLDMNHVIDTYVKIQNHDSNVQAQTARSAEDFSFEGPVSDKTASHEDVLVIDREMKGLEYSLSKCCHPVYGDEIFGFVTVNGGIKIHKSSCPNSHELHKRFGYRIVKARWSGKGVSQYTTILRVVGNDNIGILNNITSIISKEEKIMIRNINVDSSDGLFSGNIVINVDDIARLEKLIKKLNTIKGVKQVRRL